MGGRYLQFFAGHFSNLFLKGSVNFHLNEKILSNAMRIFSHLMERWMIIERNKQIAVEERARRLDLGKFVPNVRCIWLLNLLELSLPVRKTDSKLSWSQRSCLEAAETGRQTGWKVDWSRRESYSNFLD